VVRTSRPHPGGGPPIGPLGVDRPPGNPGDFLLQCERDTIRLLHKFGAKEQDNALSLPRFALLAQLEAVRAGSTYAAFLRQRQDVVKHLTEARA
jgi:hypothetical protein